MPGGGAHGLGPGQATDNSEINLALIRALVLSNSERRDDQERVLDLDAITETYHTWAATGPQQQFGKAVIESISKEAFVAKREAAEVAMGSNAIVRTYPLAIWAARLSTKDLKKVIVSEVELTNKEAVTQEAAFLYGAAIQYLLNHPQDPNRFENAFKQALELSRSELASTVNHKQDSCLNWLQEAYELS